ncbi:MAG: DNA polymerase I [Gammaproteobacteria bacterium]|jgi:DNA polymerase-1|nr:DNA polymerase I [Chromatiales bacterium]MDP6675167.1 DNA polymerase I [Gammaproteobacteria bacterium]
MTTAAVDTDRLILVDGSSYLYRAFHALPELENSSGQPTGAIHGVLAMLNKLVRDESPQYFAVIFDAPGKTFRNDLYKDYKANRPPMPDDLRAQVDPLLEAIAANGWPLLRIGDVEADDVIGTLTRNATAAGMQVMIVTGDKDMAQLVSADVTLLDTMPRGPNRSPRKTDTQGVVERFGVRAEQIIDYLALVGDSSDNIPGVPKVGPKTAVALLEHFEHVDDILNNIEVIAGLSIRGAKGLAQRIDEHRDMLLLSRDLATIKTDVELEADAASLQSTLPDLEKLRSMYEQLELRRLLDMPADLPDEQSYDQPTQKSGYEVIWNNKQLTDWLQKITRAELVGFDTETTSINYMEAELVGLSLAIAEGEAVYLPVAHSYPGAPQQLNRDEVLEQLRPWLEDPAQAKVGHHLKYDAHILSNYGIELAGMQFDSMLESYVLNSTATRHDLDSVARKYLGLETISFTDVAGKGVKQLRFDEVPIETAAPYAAEDADITLRLHETLWPQIAATGELEKVYTDLEQPLLAVLMRTEANGVLVDKKLLGQLSTEFATQMITVEARVHQAAGHPFNLGSPKQLQQVLFDELELPIIRKTPKGQPSTAEDVLSELAEEYELPQLILDYRSLSKLKSTYTDKLPLQIASRTGRIHTSYHQAVAATGRLSSSDPNLQNIPIRKEEGRRIRQAFIAPENYVLLAADYSQIELRIMAHISQDEGLLTAFAEDRDIHQATAAEVFDVPLDAVTTDQRRSAKAINFGLIYGMSAFGLGRQLGINRIQAQEYVDLYFSRYPGVKNYMDSTRESARETGFVETVLGRRLYLPDIDARQAQRRQYAERSAINAPMQGTAADIIKHAMITVDGWLTDSKTDARLIMQVHDELVLEVHQDHAEEVRNRVTELMCDAANLRVPLKVDAGIGKNWDEAH